MGGVYHCDRVVKGCFTSRGATGCNRGVTGGAGGSVRGCTQMMHR